MSTMPSAPGLDLPGPWMNVAGSLGFVPDPRGPVSLEQFGVFVTNPISLRARRASRPPRLLTFPGGALLHTGHPNPGLAAVIKRHAAAWARAPLPIIVHLLSAKPEDLRKAILRIEGLENVMAIEIGLETDMERSEVGEILHAVQGELPVIVQIPLPFTLELTEGAMVGEVAAISLGPPRGALPGTDGKPVSGRLYGAAIFPFALEAVRLLAKLKVPTIAAGGIENKAQGEAMLAAGAIGVQVDVGLWKGNQLIH